MTILRAIFIAGVLLCLGAGVLPLFYWGDDGSFVPLFWAALLSAFLVLLFSFAMRRCLKMTRKSELQSVTLVLQMATVTVGLYICLLIGALIAPLSFMLWGDGNGRNFIPALFVPAAFVGFFSFALRFWFLWKPRHILLGMTPAQLILLACIRLQSGYHGLEFFDLDFVDWDWFLGLNVFFAIPWIVGLLFGSAFLWIGSEQNANSDPHSNRH